MREFRGVLELIRDGQRQEAAKRDDGTDRRRRRSPRPASRSFRGVAEIIRDGQCQQEAVTLSNQGADGSFDRRAEADQWRRSLRAARQAAGPQGRTGCGPLDDFGNCINRTHSMTCAKSMSSAAAQAGFAQQGTREADRLWLAAKAQREQMAALTRSPAQAAAEAERAERSRAAKAEKERAAALRLTGANWAETGRGLGWFRPAG